MGRYADLALATVFVSGIVLRADQRYVDDFEFLDKTVVQQCAGLKPKAIDWPAISKEFRPRFARCTSDVEHVKNVMELLATLKDSHTGVTDTKIDWKELPGKADGMYGGGLWFGFEQGKFVLRGVMEGHALGTSVPLGSVLVAVGGEPAWFALERERRRVARFQGLSSEHSFWASMSNRLLPFGEKRELEIEFLLPEGKTKKVTVPRWGPGGKSFDFVSNFFPAGLAWKEGACSTFLETKGSKRVGFLKVTGGMDAATATAFDAAFDALKGMDALVLDCRSMGGGGDDLAWRMCGRLFTKATANGQHRLEPTGSWQFDGPVVMLQDESEVSSAETFTWALSETGRVLAIGRPTGGWGIIPHGFSLPSGLASFRLGVNDRATPIQGVHTEGIGWPPDLLVPFGPQLCSMGAEKLPDPVQTLGLELLQLLQAGVAVADTRTACRALADGDAAAFKAFAKKAAAKMKGFDGDKLAKQFVDDLKAEIALERALLELDEECSPDLLGTARRLPRLLARAKAAGLGSDGAALEKAVKAAKAEALAQEALLALLDAGFNAPDDARKVWLGKHGATRIGRFLKERWSK